MHPKAWGGAAILDLEGKNHRPKLADLKLKGGYIPDGFFTQLYHLWTTYLAIDFRGQNKSPFGSTAVVVFWFLLVEKSWSLQCVPCTLLHAARSTRHSGPCALQSQHCKRTDCDLEKPMVAFLNIILPSGFTSTVRKSINMKPMFDCLKTD